MRRVAAVVAGATCAWALVLGANAVRADAPAKVGWWNEAQQVPSPGPALPTPPTSSDGGITLANSVDGPAAWGAVSYPVGDITHATLKLTASAAITMPPGDAIIACAVDSPGWKAGGNQPWATRPAVNPLCTPGVLDAAGTSVAFELNGDFRDGEGALDVAVLPSGQVPFTADFVKPDEGSLSTTEAPSTSSGDDTSAEVADFVVPMIDATVLFPDTATSPFVAPIRPTTPSASLPATLGGARRPVAVEHPTSERIAIVVIVLGLLGWVWQLAGQDVRPPRLLGSLAGPAADTEPLLDDETPKGIGRFARPRTSRPNRL